MFLDFLKFFWICLVCAWVLFFDLKSLLLVVFSAPKVNKGHRKIRFSVNNVFFFPALMSNF